MLSVDARNLQIQAEPPGTSVAAPSVESLYNGSLGNGCFIGVGFTVSRAKSLFSIASLAPINLVVADKNNDSLSTISDLPKHYRSDSSRRDTWNMETFDFRETFESLVRNARDARQRSHKFENPDMHLSIAAHTGVPYMELRRERPFVFDEHTHPLHATLAETLRVDCLTELHKHHESDILEPLLDPMKRRIFHATYDSFVTNFILPLCHSLAIAKDVLHIYSSDKIYYKYQAFPNIRIVRPGEKPSRPTCGLADGYSIASLQFHVPLTPAVGSNALYTESYQGREDWHPLNAKSFGIGYMFDGTQCLHFDLGNTTEQTRVALDFRVMIYRDESQQATALMNPRINDFPTIQQMQDRFLTMDPKYYDEAVIDPSRSDIVVKTNLSDQLHEPSVLLGAPFAA
ncbi:hypothetical protein MPSEU_000564400 [Mayamaea pseudoterrestris]|nr:hypothetical protein MPSEU_000564400 [Mayamaea pseudoterrestris]